MRSKIRHGGILVCDAPGCSQKFVSYSFVTMIRAQARSSKWGRVPAWQIDDAASPTRKFDVCPRHVEVAKVAAGRRPEIMAARRAGDKKERDALRAAKAEVKSAERAAAKATRAGDRAVARAKKKAAKIEAKVRGGIVHVANVGAKP